MKKTLSNLFKKELLLFYIIVLIGAFFRLQGTFTNSFAFTYDVGRDMLALWNIAYLHKIFLIGPTTGVDGVFYGPWWYYLLTPFFLFFQGDPRGIALIMGLIGVLTIIFTFVFAKKIGGNFLGLTFSGLICISPNLVSLASQIWSPNIIPLFIIFILLLLRKIYQSTKGISNWCYFLFGLLLFLIIDLEIVFGLLFLIGIVVSLCIIKWRKIPLKGAALFILGAIFILSPRVLFDLRHQFIMTKSLAAFLTSGGREETRGFFEILINRINIFFNQFTFSLTMENSVLGIILSLLMLFVFIFFYKEMEGIVKNFVLTSAIIILVFFVGTLLFRHDIWPHYLVGLPVLYLLLFSLSLYLLRKKLSQNLIPIAIFCIIFILNLNPGTLINSFNKPLWEGDASVYRNQLAVIDYVYSQAKGREFKYVTYTPPVYDYTYQYLFNWYGKKRYHYQPKIQAKLAFFILEPDLQHPSRLNNWLKQREKDGKIIKEEKIKGGIIVQTRIVE